MAYQWYDLVGNIGVLCILGAYLLLQLNLLDSKSISFSICNMIGAVLILVSLSFDFNLSAFLIEFFWLLISLIGLYKSLKAKLTRK